MPIHNNSNGNKPVKKSPETSVADTANAVDPIPPAFVQFGWYFPVGLNRKTRRRVQFVPGFHPTEVEGAQFVGMTTPDGPISDEQLRVALLVAGRPPDKASYAVLREALLAKQLKEKGPAVAPSEVKSRSPPPEAKQATSPKADRGRGRGAALSGGRGSGGRGVTFAHVPDITHVVSAAHAALSNPPPANPFPAKGVKN